MPYEQQLESLASTFFGTTDSYSHYLRELGHEAAEVIVNCRPLQRAWSEQHALARDSSEEAVLLAQVREFEPDVVYVQHVHYLSDSALTEIQSSCRALVGQLATDPPKIERLRCFRLVITSLPHFVARFRDKGVNAQYVRLAFDERILRRVEAEPPPGGRYGAVFVGSLGRTQHFRSNGVLGRAARSTPIDFWGYRAGWWPPWSPVRRRYHGEAWGLDMYRILHGSSIAVNRHADIAGTHANNMRLYEATGMGTMLLTDAKSDLGDLFEIGTEVVTYSTAGELADRVAYYLEHEDERAAIAQAGQQRTLREHTYARRMPEIADLLEALVE